jgi:hypothetical protein
MSEFVQREIENFYNLKWLDTYMIGHKGYIAGGCFKNIFNNEKVKDIDIFFESKKDYQAAKSYYDKDDDYHFYYSNEKVVSYKHKKSGISIELIKSTFASPEEMLSQFDFSIAKFAYYKTETEEYSNDTDNIKNEKVIEYKIVHHKDLFEHLMLKRLVVGQNITFPNSTFERMIRYIKYGYSPCRETKMNIITAIRTNNNHDDVLSDSLYFGMD